MAKRFLPSAFDLRWLGAWLKVILTVQLVMFNMGPVFVYVTRISILNVPVQM